MARREPVIGSELLNLIGIEQPIDRVSDALKHFVRRQDAPIVGAYHLTCSDESERECVESFHTHFVREMLPELKNWSRAAFRTANLGGRYEPGALAIADQHFSTEESRTEFKVMVTKLNSHVCVDESGETLRFGRMLRYARESTYCGGLHALMAGSELPFAQALRRSFGQGGVDRLAMLADPDIVDSRCRSLAVAIVNTTLQASHVLTEIGQLAHSTPTLHVIAACVTLNRQRKDTEILCDLHLLDTRATQPIWVHRGLADRPDRYVFDLSGPRIRITEAGGVDASG